VERVREALERVLGDGAFRAAAERVRTEISAMPAPEAVVAELERRYAPTGPV
jgi:UDP:flavonoid glycosyltransferase YjiC (YdhE family)